MCSPLGQLKRYQWVENHGWVGVYPDPANPDDEFCELVDYNFPVTYSQMVPELRPPELEQGVAPAVEQQQDAPDSDDILDDLDDSELNAVQDVLALSQHLGTDTAADPALQLVRDEQVARARKRSQGGQEQDSSSRWGARKQNSVVNNERTLKTNKTGITAFCSWLQEVHKLQSAPEDLDREKLIKLLSEFVLVMRRQDGKEYKRNALITMVNSILRHVNASYAQRVLEGDQAAPAQIILNQQPLLHNNVDAACRELHKIGNGSTGKQEGLTKAEFQSVLAAVKGLPETSFKHTARSNMILGTNWGGRVSEFHTLLISQFELTTDSEGNLAVKFTVPQNIKQAQGGLRRSKGQQVLDDNPDIFMYENTHDEFLDPVRWFKADKEYRSQAADRSQLAQPCPKLFLQLGRKNPAKSTKRKAAAESSSEPFAGVEYQNFFTNSPLGKDRFTWIAHTLCDLAGIPRRTNHGFSRRNLVEHCLRIRMPIPAIMKITRHTSEQGLLAYCGVDDGKTKEFADARNAARAAVNQNPQVPHAPGRPIQPPPARPSLQPLPAVLANQVSSASGPPPMAKSAAANPYDDMFFDEDAYEPVPDKPVTSNHPTAPPTMISGGKPIGQYGGVAQQLQGAGMPGLNLSGCNVSFNFGTGQQMGVPQQYGPYCMRHATAVWYDAALLHATIWHVSAIWYAAAVWPLSAIRLTPAVWLERVATATQSASTLWSCWRSWSSPSATWQ